MYKVISFGHRCTSAGFIKLLNLKTESYPFDWLVSKLDVIKDCIETDFVHFLNPDNYITKNIECFNITNNTKKHICHEVAHINTYYETDVENIQTGKFKLAINHHDIISDRDYYQRCITRLYELLKMDIRKYYIHFHPLVGTQEYDQNKECILNEFEQFNQFIRDKTKNIFGLYFILINDNTGTISIKLKEDLNYAVFIIYCNDNFLDGGETFMGVYPENFLSEEQEVLRILQSYLS